MENNQPGSEQQVPVAAGTQAELQHTNIDQRSMSLLPADLQQDSISNIIPHHELKGSSTTNSNSRQASPAPSSTSALSSITATPPPVSPLTQTGTDVNLPPSKKRKLTAFEKDELHQAKIQKKLARDREKNEKEQERAEKKAKKEEEKLVKDEEKRVKNEQKEEKKREKDLANQAKEQAKREKEREKEEEEARKRRAQPSINAFFNKPASSPNGKPKAAALAHQPTVMGSSARKSNVSVGAPTERDCDIEMSSEHAVAPNSDYERTFLPFAIPSFTSIAPSNRFSWSQAALDEMREVWNDDWHSMQCRSIELMDCLPLGPACVTDPYIPPRTIDVLEMLNGSLQQPIDLTGEEAQSSANPLNHLARIPLKYIFFHQDVRPPYIGTHTGIRSEQEMRKIARNPLKQQRPEVDYDDDSEAEWEEDENAEDLASEGEDDAESVADSDDIDFLDDEEADGDGSQRPKKRIVTKDIEPICTGLCWENEHGQSDCINTAFQVSNYAMEFISDDHQIGFDPFASSNWPAQPSTPAIERINPFTSAASMSLTRAPLADRPNLNGQTMVNSLDPSLLKSKSGHLSKQPGQLLGGSELELFKERVNGQKLDKQALVSVLKQDHFPKIKKAILQNTLNAVAEKKGGPGAKKWVIKDTLL